MNCQLISVILLALISLSTSQTCDKSILDIMLVIDASGSIGLDNYNLAKDAIINLIQNFNIGANKVKVGIINYSSSVETIKSLIDTDQDKNELIAAVQNMVYLNGGTATGDALDRARQIFFNNKREDSPRVAILFTDGYSNDGSDVKDAADLLKDQLVEIYTVGITTGINHDELDYVSSVPLSKYKKLITNYQQLMASINEITITACGTPAFLTPRSPMTVKDVPRNEVRNYQVDVSKLSKAGYSLVELTINTNKGICLMEKHSWYPEQVFVKNDFLPKEPIETIN